MLLLKTKLYTQPYNRSVQLYHHILLNLHTLKLIHELNESYEISIRYTIKMLTWMQQSVSQTLYSPIAQPLCL